MREEKVIVKSEGKDQTLDAAQNNFLFNDLNS